MAIKISSEIAARLLKARQDVRLTQLELSEKSHISLRLIKDLESGRRKSFNEDTLIRLCRALNLDYKTLNGSNGAMPAKVRKFAGKPSSLFFAGSFILAAALFGFISFIFMNKPRERTDWVFNAQLPVKLDNPPWIEDGVIVNYYHLKQVVGIGDTNSVEIKWSYHFGPGSKPVFYISAFGNWNPDKEIRVFTGTVFGDSSQILKFGLDMPNEPGLFKVRIFFASAYAPMSSFYGHPPINQPTSPGSVPYIEIPIEVLPK